MLFAFDDSGSPMNVLEIDVKNIGDKDSRVDTTEANVPHSKVHRRLSELASSCPSM